MEPNAWDVLIELEGPADFDLDAGTFTRLFDLLYGYPGARFFGSGNRITARLMVERDATVARPDGAAVRARQIVFEAMTRVGLDPWTVTTVEVDPIEELDLTGI